MQDALEQALSLMRDIRELIAYINERCESLNLPCGRIPLRLRYRPVLLQDVERCNVFRARNLRFRSDHLALEVQRIGRDYRSVPLTGAEAELFVQRVHPDCLPEFVAWLGDVKQWLERRKPIVDRMAERKLSRLHCRIGWFRAVLLWLDELLSGTGAM